MGWPEAPARTELIAAVRATFRPWAVVAVASPGAGDRSAVALLHERPTLGDAPTAYVCRGFVCLRPVTDPQALRAQLEAGQAA